MADDENKNVNGSENAAAESATPAPAPAPEPAPAASAPAKAPAKPLARKPGLAAQLKQQQADSMVEGPDGKKHRRVSTITKVKAFLALALPIAMVVLIGVGFIPMLEEGQTLWGKVYELFFGEPQQGGRTAREYIKLIADLEDYAKTVSGELSQHTEALTWKETGKLVEKQDQLQKIYDMIGRQITTLEKARNELKSLGVDKPKPEEFDALIAKFMPTMNSYKDLLVGVEKKIAENKPPEPPPGEPGKPEDKGVIIESGPAHPKKPEEKKPEPPKEEPPKEEPKPEPPKEEPKPEPPKEEAKPEPPKEEPKEEPMPPKEEPKPEPPKEEPKPEPPKEEPKPEPMPPKEEPKPEPPKEEPKPEPPKEEPKPEPPKEEPKPEPPKEEPKPPAVDKFAQADEWVVKANASTKTIAGKMKNLPAKQEELKSLLDGIRKTQAVYKKALGVYETDPGMTERADKVIKLHKLLEDWAKTVQSKLQ